jgi:hypothetical protein
MHQFTSTVTVESKKLDGVSFVVRRLSAVERANRDLLILDPQIRLTEINERMKLIRAPYQDETDAEGKPIEGTAREAPLEVLLELTKLDREAGCLINAHSKPATIRAGFVSAKGLTYDGKEATADLILANGPDVLIDEIWIAIDEHSGLTPDQKKASESSGTSSEVELPEASNSTAIGASVTGPTIPATAPSIFPEK